MLSLPIPLEALSPSVDRAGWHRRDATPESPSGTYSDLLTNMQIAFATLLWRRAISHADVSKVVNSPPLPPNKSSLEQWYLLCGLLEMGYCEIRDFRCEKELETRDGASLGCANMFFVSC